MVLWGKKGSQAEMKCLLGFPRILTLIPLSNAFEHLQEGLGANESVLMLSIVRVYQRHPSQKKKMKIGMLIGVGMTYLYQLRKETPMPEDFLEGVSLLEEGYAEEHKVEGGTTDTTLDSSEHRVDVPQDGTHHLKDTPSQEVDAGEINDLSVQFASWSSGGKCYNS